jgi:hypothetical protein
MSKKKIGTREIVERGLTEGAKEYLNNKNEELKKFKEVKMAFVDVLDGWAHWHNIMKQTGLSKERCKEIEQLFNKLYSELSL